MRCRDVLSYSSFNHFLLYGFEKGGLEILGKYLTNVSFSSSFFVSVKECQDVKITQACIFVYEFDLLVFAC